MNKEEKEQIVQRLLEILSTWINNELRLNGYIPPACPTCHFPLSGYMASTKLVCLKCGSVFETKLIGTERT